MMPLVSVCMLTYNHERFIAQAIESVIAQKVDFTIELVIGEDSSTDKTRELCEKYALLYPEIVKLLPKAAHNLGSQKNFIYTFSNCTGKYVAMLEGDDFWSDPLKLQKQVNYLENNPDFVLSFHDITVINETGEETDDKRLPHEKKRDYDKNELLLGHYLPTPTTVFRNFAFDDYKQYFEKTINGDTILQAILTQMGKVKFIDSIQGSVIRVHSGGVWSSRGYLERWCWSLKTYRITYSLLGKDLKSQVFQHFYNTYEMAAWDADYYNSDKYWLRYNLSFLSFLVAATEYGKAFLILRRIAKRFLVR
ncbi:glycosyltransferase [Pontibacter sp. MBLB2868]|uniref:glycosyltransferase n=1 Tax=Pontibacter sp. MBLB2868 TaxID=3451555 RepID=UPI003F751F5C